MKQVFIKKGGVYIREVPAPVARENTVLVQVCYSCISTGTEMSAVAHSGESILKRVLKQPEKISKAISHVKDEGILKTAQKVQEESGGWIQTGYSASGVVIDAGADIRDVERGNRVACAGAGFANHAEYIEVPRNLMVKIPDGVGFDLASTVSLGAIAMQGVRRADVKLGEYVAVIGLGAIGQITSQLLKANGCRVIGIDLNDGRLNKAIELGIDKTINPQNEDLVKMINGFSNGYGVDVVIITAATDSDEPLSQAFQICRKRGKVVLVGVVGMKIDREQMYKKESDFLISTSYGPGRYDEKYEQKGIDYPYGYVRWTQARNIGEYLRLIADKKIGIGPLIEREYRIEEALAAYEELKRAGEKPLIVLLKYKEEGGGEKGKIAKKIEAYTSSFKKAGRINVAVIGAGGFAKCVHLPNLVKLKDLFDLYAVMSKTANNAFFTAEKFGARYATTDYNEILADNNIQAVIIATRHNLHAKLAEEALRAGKAVFLEKPMALNKKELDDLADTIIETKMPFMVGFNRRFSKYAQEAKRHISKRINPMIINCQMNAGYIPPDHWVYTEEGGGRIIGEACHIFDLFNYFTEAEVEAVRMVKIIPNTEYFFAQDNAVITLKYKDGSVCTLTYTALGNSHYPKELCHIYYDGKIIVINDYRELEGYGVKLKGLRSKKASKGQFEELVEFARYLKGETKPPIPLWQLIQATEISFVKEAETQMPADLPKKA